MSNVARFLFVGVLAFASSNAVQSDLRSAEITPVDLELVLAVDVSGSIDPTEYRLQIEGLAKAFRDPAVIAAIKGAGSNGIAVTMMQWSASWQQEQVLPWTHVRDEFAAAAFAKAISQTKRRFVGKFTALGSALVSAQGLFMGSRFEGRRRSIDVMTDGSNNSGVAPSKVRDAITAEGTTINALAILYDEPMLGEYCAKHVIGGPGAFVMTVANYSHIVAGTRNKLLREISMVTVEAPLNQPNMPASALWQLRGTETVLNSPRGPVPRRRGSPWGGNSTRLDADRSGNAVSFGGPT